MAPTFSKRQKTRQTKKHEYLIKSDLKNLSIVQFVDYIKKRYSEKIVSVHDAFYSKEKGPFIILGKVSQPPPKLQGEHLSIWEKVQPATCLNIKEVLTSSDEVKYGSIFKAKLYGEVAKELLAAVVEVGDRIALIKPSRLEENTEWKNCCKRSSLITPVLLDDSHSSVVISKKVKARLRPNTPDSPTEDEPLHNKNHCTTEKVTDSKLESAKKITGSALERAEKITMKNLVLVRTEKSDWIQRESPVERQKTPPPSVDQFRGVDSFCQRQKTPPNSPDDSNNKIARPPACSTLDLPRVPRPFSDGDESSHHFINPSAIHDQRTKPYNYVKIRDINSDYVNKRIDIFGIVVDVLLVNLMDKKEKEMLKLKVIDETCSKYEAFEILIFFRVKPIINEKWAVRLRNVKIELYEGNINGRVFIEGAVVCYPLDPGNGLPPFITARKKPYTYSEDDKAYVEKLRHFIVGKSWNIIAVMNCSYPSIPDLQHVKLENISDQSAINLKCEIMSVRWFLDAKIAVLTVGDGTVCEQYSYRVPSNCTLWPNVITCREKYACGLMQVEIIVKNVAAAFETIVQPKNFVDISHLQLRRNKIPAGCGLMFLADLRQSSFNLLSDKENQTYQSNSQANDECSQESSVTTNDTEDTAERLLARAYTISPDLLGEESFESSPDNTKKTKNIVRKKKLYNHDDSQFDYISAKNSNCSIVVTKLDLTKPYVMKNDRSSSERPEDSVGKSQKVGKSTATKATEEIDNCENASLEVQLSVDSPVVEMIESEELLPYEVANIEDNLHSKNTTPKEKIKSNSTNSNLYPVVRLLRLTDDMISNASDCSKSSINNDHVEEIISVNSSETNSLSDTLVSKIIPKSSKTRGKRKKNDLHGEDHGKIFPKRLKKQMRSKRVSVIDKECEKKSSLSISELSESQSVKMKIQHSAVTSSVGISECSFVKDAQIEDRTFVESNNCSVLEGHEKEKMSVVSPKANRKEDLNKTTVTESTTLMDICSFVEDIRIEKGTAGTLPSASPKCKGNSIVTSKQFQECVPHHIRSRIEEVDRVRVHNVETVYVDNSQEDDDISSVIITASSPYQSFNSSPNKRFKFKKRRSKKSVKKMLFRENLDKPKKSQPQNLQYSKSSDRRKKRRSKRASTSKTAKATPSFSSDATHFSPVNETNVCFLERESPLSPKNINFEIKNWSPVGGFHKPAPKSPSGESEVSTVIFNFNHGPKFSTRPSLRQDDLVVEKDDISDSEESHSKIVNWLSQQSSPQPSAQCVEKNCDIDLQVNSNVDYSNESELKGASNETPLESQNLTEFVKANCGNSNIPYATVSSVVIRSQISFSASMWDLRPSISEYPLDVISGFCKESCQNFFRYSTLKFNSDSKPICPGCKLEGKEIEVKLQFLFELLLILQSFHSVVALVYADHASTLFGCTEIQYIEDDSLRSKVIKKLDYYLGSTGNCSVRYTPPFPVNLIVINANTADPSCSMRFCLVNTTLPTPAGRSSDHSLFGGVKNL